MHENVTVHDMMLAYAEDAVELSLSQFGKRLDFSETSTRTVDDILAIYSATIPRGLISKIFKRAPTKEQLAQVCKMFGAYVGEVVRRHAGGKWVLIDDASQPIFGVCLVIGESTLSPVAKVYNRISNGDEDNVWVYSNLVIQDAGQS